MPIFYRFFLLVALCFACQDKKNQTYNTPNKSKTEIKNSRQDTLVKLFNNRITNDNVVDFYTKYGKENPEKKVRITTKFGDIDIELFEDTPLHRANFIHIVKRGFLSETCFYRVAKDFVVQGGNSDSFKMARIKGKIGKFTLPAEFKPHHKHEYAAVAMARIWKNNPERRSSPFEFYIVVNTENAKHLNGEHTVIGKVIKGMDVVKEINKVEVDKSEWPINDVCMKVQILE